MFFEGMYMQWIYYEGMYMQWVCYEGTYIQTKEILEESLAEERENKTKLTWELNRKVEKLEEEFQVQVDVVKRNTEVRTADNQVHSDLHVVCRPFMRSH